MNDILVDYIPSPTIRRFHASDAFFRGLMGPVGSGKSVGCCMEIMQRAMRQRPGPDKIRKSRWAVVRNTYRELTDTTMKTWFDWFPEGKFGRFVKSDMTHFVRIPAPGGDVYCEVLFRALDKPRDVAKLLSLELTGGWVNEAREVPKGIIDVLLDRVERYPAVKDGGCTWAGVFADTNPPDDDSWWYGAAEHETPEGWGFFKQPGGLVEANGQFSPNPEAENLKNLPEGYYVTRMAGKGLDHIRVYYCNQYGFVVEGKPVWSEFVDAVHTSQVELVGMPGLILYIGIDFGLTPAAVFAQPTPLGRWQAIDELVTEDMGTSRFGELLKAKINREYPEYELVVTGDPAGSQRAQTDEKTPFQILRKKGVEAKKAHTNDFEIRREAVANCLTRLVEGKPGLIISPKCKVLRKAMAGGYCYKRLQVSGGEKYSDKPDKNKFSHVADALQYCLLGGGEGRKVIRTPRSGSAQDTADSGFDPHRR